MTSIDVSKKKKRGRPAVDTERVVTRMPRELLDKLDAWAKAQPDTPTRPEAVRRLVAKALKDDVTNHDS
jgi:metal-responsive CopG/Arc/MetJ family transcriptional regulator